MKEGIGGWDYFRYWFSFLIGCRFACKSTDSLPDGQVSHSFFPFHFQYNLSKNSCALAGAVAGRVAGFPKLNFGGANVELRPPRSSTSGVIFLQGYRDYPFFAQPTMFM